MSELKMQSTFLLLLFMVILAGAQHDHREKYYISVQTDWDAPMDLNVRAMHRHCKGQCYYLPESCKSNLGGKECRNIVSIQKFEPSCTNVNKSGAADVCKRKGHLFIISLLQTVNPMFIRKAKRQEYITVGKNNLKCNVEPFVAISFTDNGDDSVKPTNAEEKQLGDVFYVCAARQPYVTTWIKSTPSSSSGNDTTGNVTDPGSCLGKGNSPEFEQLKGTNPYPPMGASVIWSKVDTMYNQYAIGCKFIASNLESDLAILFSNETTLHVPIFTSSKIKVANGVAYTKDDILEDVIFNSKSSKIEHIATVYEDNATIYAFDSHLSWDGPELAVPTQPPDPYLRAQKDQIAEEEILKVYAKCMDKWMMCFTRQDELTCILRQGCHLLVAMEALDRNFTTLRVHMILQTTKRPGIVRRVYPRGWGAVGFSNDTHMGRDLVFTCVYYGEEHLSYASYNHEQNNILVTDPAHWIKPPEETMLKFFLNMQMDTAMCVFDVSTSDVILSSFFYAPPNTNPHKPEEWPQLHWYLKSHDFDILLAQGTTMYWDGRLSYHTYSGVSDTKFSQERYWDHVVMDHGSHEVPSPAIYVFVAYFTFYFLIQ